MTFKELKTLSDGQNAKEIEQYLEATSKDDLCSIISSGVDDVDFAKVIQDTLKHGSSESIMKKKCKIILAVIDSLKKADLTTSRLNSIITALVFTFSSLSPTHLKSIIDYCLEDIKNNESNTMSWKDILPTLLELLQDEKLVAYDSGSVSGREYKSLVIKSICNNEWDKSILTSLAKMFSEISMEKNDLEMVNRTLCMKLEMVELTELPPLVHQMLIMNQDDAKLLFITLSQYFSKKYREAEEEEDEDECRAIGKLSIKEIQDSESTVLYHIHKATLVNKSLKDFIKFLKNNVATPEFSIEPFIMSVLLLVTDLYPEFLELLKTALVRQLQDEAKRKHSLWLRKMTSNDWSIMEVISKIVVNSGNKDRHFVLQGLLDLSFLLMSSTDKKRAAGDKKDEVNVGEIGLKILQRVLRKRHASGTVILQHLTSNILEHDVSNAMRFIDCLSFMCHKLTMVVLDYKVWIKTLLEQLPLMPGPCAIQTIYAVLPIINTSSTVQDAFLIVLRKCLYRKGTDSRQMAVIGFMQILKKVKIGSLNAFSQSNSSMSHSSCSQNYVLTQAMVEKKANTRTSAALCREILNLLSKCFTHEFEVRLRLYKELYELVSVNSELADNVTKMLVDRFISFYNPDEDVLPPVDLDKCVVSQEAEVICQEPIGNLVYALQKIYVATASKNSPQIERLSMILESLCKRMAQLELEHMQMEDGIEFFDDIPTALSKIQGLKLCVTICEALIAYRIDSWSKESVAFAQSTAALMKTYNRLIEFTKKAAKPKKDSKKKDKDKDKDGNDTTVQDKKNSKNALFSQAVKLPPTIFEFKTIEKILELLYLDSVPWAAEEQSNNLRSRIEFHYFIFQALSQLLHNSKAKKPVDSRKLSEYNNIGKLLYKHIVLMLEKVRDFDEQTSVLGLECFRDLCDLICSCLPTELPTFLEAISDIERCDGLDAQIREIVPNMLQIVQANCNIEEEVDGPIAKKIPVILMETISHLLHKMPFEKGDNKPVLHCLYQMAVDLDETVISDKSLRLQIVTSLAQMILLVEESLNPKSKILNEMCCELLVELGNSIGDEVMEYPRKLKIIDESTAKDIYEIVNAALKQKLTIVDWYFNRLKAEQNCITIKLEKAEAQDNLKEKERNLCSQLNVITEMLEIMTQVKQKSFSDSIFKNVQFLFNILCKLTKYFHSKSSANNPAFQSVGFLSVIKRAGKDVKNHVYNLISFVELNQKVDESKDNCALRNKVLRETKTIPKVIYEMEQFQKDLILLEKKTKVDLKQHTKRSVNRDFRIDNELLEKGLEKMDTTQFTNTQASHLDDASMTDTTANESAAETPVQQRKSKKKKTQQ